MTFDRIRQLAHRHFAWLLCLALLLPLAQLAGAGHALVHLQEEQQQESGKFVVHLGQCQDCIAAAAVAAGAPPGDPAVPVLVPVAQPVLALPPAPEAPPPGHLFFSSRAPPPVLA